MKLIIDISKDRYDEIMSMDWKNCRLIFDEEIRAIHDGKALEQESCDDAISREAVMHILDEVGGDFDSPREAVVPIDYIADMVSDLPSVSPQPKMGYWEWVQYDGNSNIGNWHCSECNRIVCGAITAVNPVYAYKYCPNCGAKMSEIPTVEEGSDKE